MIKVDLITGFLGSGKTTFLKRYARFLMRSGLKIGILENDYGAVNVDMLLLSDLEGDNCGLEMVAGACDADCHKRRFKTKLIALAMSGYDRVIVEPSGVFDVDEFFDVLCEDPLDRMCETGSVITIADANMEDNLSDSAQYLLASQLADAGAVVLSKTQSATALQKERTVLLMEEALEKVFCRKPIRSFIIDKSWDDFTDTDFEFLMNCGCDSASYVKRGTVDESGFRSLYFMNCPFTASTLTKCAKELFESENCGRVFRVKGFVRDGDGWFEVNATRSNMSVKPIARGQEIVIVVGEKLSETEVRKVFAGSAAI